MRTQLINLIKESVSSGASQSAACKLIGLQVRTLQRWIDKGNIKADGRPLAQHPTPPHKLSEAEIDEIIQVSNETRFVNLPPSQVVPTLADEGRYIASESSFYRVLRQHDQQKHRGRSVAPKKTYTPTTHIATAANQLWSWDISYLPSNIKGLFFYLYLILDIYSRKIVGYEVYAIESGEFASALIQRAILAEGIMHKPLILHSDNGAPMKSQTFMAKLAELKISPSYSRPRVSNDNPYSEALFRTLKYCPQWPEKGFATIWDARSWVEGFVQTYNEHHRHSQIQFVTPGQRHRGEDVAILQNRAAVYAEAKARNPARWSGDIRNCEAAGAVSLNPEKTEAKNAAKMTL